MTGRPGDPPAEQQTRNARHDELVTQARDEVARLELAARRAHGQSELPPEVDDQPVQEDLRR